MELNTLKDLLIHQLKDLHSAETQLIKALPKMIKKVSNTSLSETLQNHLSETERQVQRLDEMARSLAVDLAGLKCRAMTGLIKEAAEALKHSGDNRLVDAALIAAAQRIEHYEISAYGTARTLAAQLGLHETATKLRETEEEESAADEKLTMLAVDEIYPSLKLMAGSNDNEGKEKSFADQSFVASGR